MKIAAKTVVLLGLAVGLGFFVLRARHLQLKSKGRNAPPTATRTVIDAVIDEFLTLRRGPTGPPNLGPIPEFVPPAETPEIKELWKLSRESVQRDKYYDHLEGLIRERALSAPAETAKILNRRLEVMDRMGYFQQSVANSGQMYTFVGYLLKHRSDLEEIGAVGCLKALEGLAPFYQEEQRMPEETMRREYRWKTQSAREAFETIGEDYDVLRELLINYANTTLAGF
ncbi:MAG: hypothetical protein QOE70_5351 [Chthoniobacter sp.]|jgi:hypothetical protein|nr:hypothetical protein [Chthoniobacter sp.]